MSQCAHIYHLGKGKESDPTDALADTLLTHHRHTTNTSANTLPMCRPTHYQHVGQHTTVQCLVFGSFV